MHDDQRPRDDNPEEDIDDEFDDALDELFGPDDEPVKAQPSSSGQRPQPAGGRTPPERVYVPDHESHQYDDEHVLGPENAAPPPSYASERVSTSQPAPESATSAGSPFPPNAGMAPSPPPSRDWRKIACFGCLILVGIPALCLAGLVAWGFSTGVESESTSGGVFVDDTNSGPTAPATTANTPAGSFPDPYATIMDGREMAPVEVLGQNGFGTPGQPVPVGFTAPVGAGWDLQINTVTENADEIIAGANMFNNPPAENRQFVMANVTATRKTEPAAVFDGSFELRLVGGITGASYTTFGAIDRCGVIPDPIPDVEIISTESVTGNVCWQVAVGDLRHLMLYRESYSDTDPITWFTITLDGAMTSAP